MKKKKYCCKYWARENWKCKIKNKSRKKKWDKRKMNLERVEKKTIRKGKSLKPAWSIRCVDKQQLLTLKGKLPNVGTKC